MKASRLALSVFLLFATSCAFVRADDLPRVHDDAKRIVGTLASRMFWGRGYTNGGMGMAADFILAEVKTAGLTPLDGKSFEQKFEMPVNTFPGKMEVHVNDRLLVPGLDYIVSPGSPGGKFSGDLKRDGFGGDFLDASSKVTFTFADKLTWSVSKTPKPDEVTTITLDRARLKETPKRFSAEIEAKFVENFQARNITAVVRGTAKTDKIVLFTAHYDHLGGMGRETYFPGANDNASGVALLLSLAKYYAAHPQPYSVGFIFFAAEEAGLIGSKYFVEHPTIDLKKIRFVMNFDLVGTGEDGATVVNATEFPDEFSILQKVNAEGQYLVKIKPRGKAPNSDHYWFTEHGVPAFFLYTMGGIKAYHDIFDRAETLPLNKIEDVFSLTLKFGQSL